MVRFVRTLVTGLCSYGSGKSVECRGHPTTLKKSVRRRRTIFFEGTSFPLYPFGSSSSSTFQRLSREAQESPAIIDEDEDTFTWLVVGDGDLSYSSTLAKDLASMETSTRLIATVLENEERHNQIYHYSRENTEIISSHSSHQVQFGIDATNLPHHFSNQKFDAIEFNFPHWRGKTNAKRNRELVDNFLKSAARVLKPKGEIRIALCHHQGGMPADSLDEWRKSWMPALYAAEHGLMLTRLEPYEPRYRRSSHRGIDRSFVVGDNPKRYTFQFPNGSSIPNDLEISCRHELRIMLHPDKLQKSCVDYDVIVHGTAVAELAQAFVPRGIRFEIPARHLLAPDRLREEQVFIAVFLLNYSGESLPLTRHAADQIRENIEKEIASRWGLTISKGGRLVSRPYPYLLLPKLIKEYN